MDTTAVKTFTFENVSEGTRVSLSALDRDGQSWFVAADVCKALDIKNHRDALSRLEEDEKGVVISDTLGGRQQVSIINESGLYFLIFRSTKEQARLFRKWVTSVVLPSVRKHGGYINGQEGLPTQDQAQTALVVTEEALRIRERHYEEKYDRQEALRTLRRLR